MFDRRNLKKAAIVIPLLLLAFLSQTAQAYAWGDWGRDRDWGHHGYRHHYDHDYPYGRAVVVLPHGFLTVVIGGGRYYYCDGIFYRQSEREYIIVPTPVGAVISVLPRGYHKIIIDGTVYYSYNGVYYRRISDGYLVVETPAPVIVDTASNPPAPAAAPTDVVSAAQTNTQDSFIVNIPNSKGGYTPVTLKRSGYGFRGPQGEFYPEFPKVEQLKVMYAK